MNLKINNSMQSEEWKENRMKKMEQNLREVWDKHVNIHVMGIPEQKERKEQKKILEEIIAKSQI